MSFRNAVRNPLKEPANIEQMLLYVQHDRELFMIPTSRKIAIGAIGMKVIEARSFDYISGSTGTLYQLGSLTSTSTSLNSIIMGIVSFID